MAGGATQHQHPLIGALRKAWHLLTEPAQAIVDAALRRRASILSGLLAIMFVGAVANLLLRPAIPPVLLAIIPLLLAIYAISRTRLVALAMALALALVIATPFASVALQGQVQPEHVTMSLAWLAAAVLMGSILVPVQWLAVVVVVTLLSVALAPLFLPPLEFASVTRSLWFLGTVSALVFPAALLRERYEARNHAYTAELLASEERYRRLVELSPDGIAVHQQGRVVYINPTGLRLIGADSPEQVIGKPALDFVHPDYHAIVTERIRRSYELGEPSDLIEEKLIRLDGSPVSVEIVAIPIAYHGQPAIQVVIRDISERKRAEADMRRFQEFNEGIVQSMTEGIVIETANGYFAFANPAAARMLGYDLHGLVGLHWTDIIPPDQHHLVHAANERRRQGQSDSYELQLVRKDGRRLPVLVSGSPRHNNEEVGGTLAVFTDISALKAAEAALLHSEERYRSIIESIDDGYFEVSLDGSLTFANEALSRISGYPLDELLGMSYRQYTNAAASRQMFQQFREVYETGQPARLFETEIIRRNGTRCPIEVSVTLVRDADGSRTGFRGIVRDVTERRLAEEALRAAYDALKNIDRLKDEMIQNISHEFRTPLTYLVSYVDLLRDPSQGLGPLTAEQVSSLDVMHDQAMRLTRLVNDFIRLHQIEEHGLQREPVDPVGWLSLVVEAARLVARDAGITLSLEAERGLPMVLIDPSVMRQVIDNLMSNAFKFTPQGGSVTVRVSLRRGKVQVAVRDTGIGIPEDEAPNIFERFYQIDRTSRRRFAGLGLGLAICKRVIDAHGESIWVESRPGQGTTFTFTMSPAPES
jgi:PAS domain S-box-containing protein